MEDDKTGVDSCYYLIKKPKTVLNGQTYQKILNGHGFAFLTKELKISYSNLETIL